MKLYVFPVIDNLTERDHSEGAAVIMTDRDPFEVLAEYQAKHFDKTDSNQWGREGDQALDFYEDLVEVFETDAAEEAVHIFPDAGCC